MRDFTEECAVARDRAVAAAREEIRIFAGIIGVSLVDTWLVGDTDRRGGDPHGIACFGDYSFGMSDVHDVIKHYPTLIERYGNNDEVATWIIRWYDHYVEDQEFNMNLRSWLLGAPMPTEEEKAKSRATVKALKKQLLEEAKNYNPKKQF